MGSSRGGEAGLPHAGAGGRPARRHRAAPPAAGLPVPLVPRHRRAADRRSTTAPCCRAATTAWGRSRRRTATCGWSATTRSTTARRRRSGPGTPYDAMARGGTTTTVQVTPFGEVVEAFTSLNGTQMNCSGGACPGARGSPARRRSTGPTSAPTSPASRTSRCRSRTATSSRSRPAASRTGSRSRAPAGSPTRRRRSSPNEGALYLTEDNFAFPSGFYRYIPPQDPMETGSLANGGRLQMLRGRRADQAHLEANQTNGATYDVEWVDIADPNPTFPTRRAARTDDEQRRDHLRRQPGPGAGSGALLPPRGRHVYEGRDLLHLDPGRRRGRDRPDTRRRLRQRQPGRCGRTTRRADADVRLPVARRRRARPARQHHRTATRARS